MAVVLDCPGRSLKDQAPGNQETQRMPLTVGAHLHAVFQVGVVFVKVGKGEAMLLHDVKYLTRSLKN